MRRTSLSACFAAATVMVVCLGTASPSRAALGTCGTAGNYYDGGLASGITQYGVSADIETQLAALCGGINTSSLSYTWVAEEGHESAGTAQQYWGIAQIGYYGFADGSGNEVMAEWCESHCGNYNNIKEQDGGSASGTKNFAVVYDANAGDLEMWNGTSMLHATAWDPLVSWAYPWRPEVFGETYHCESDVPGTQSNPVSITSIKKMYDRTYDWNQINSFALQTPDCSRYHKQWLTQPDSFKIWTDPLN